jgi:glycosyltransferase involved in cell wall biosynthesis
MQQGIPFAVWALGSDIWSLGRIPLVRTRLRGVLRAANVCYADGLQLASDVESISGRNCRFLASSRMLPDSVRNEKANKAPYKFAYLGRWHENKGVDLLVDALGQLEGRDWEGISQIRICGGGPLQDHVFSGVEALRRKGRPVTTGGYLDKQSAADLIGWADYLLLPSRIESIPVIFSDAVQLRTPIIATPVGDLPRLFDKYGVGLLADDVDAASIADAVRQAQKLDAGAYGEGLDAAAADFDTANIAAHFAQHARQALDE